MGRAPVCVLKLWSKKEIQVKGVGYVKSLNIAQIGSENAGLYARRTHPKSGSLVFHAHTDIALQRTGMGRQAQWI